MLKFSNLLRIILFLTATFFLLFVLIQLYYNSMNGFNHNDDMYIAAGYLVSEDKALYTDFAHVQMPLLPLVYGTFFKYSGTTHYFFAGKIFSYVLLLLSGLVIFFISQRMLKDFLISECLLILFLLNSTFVVIAEETSNYVLSVLFSLLGFLFFDLALEHRINRYYVFFSGVCIALATATKAYFAPIFFPFFIISLLYPRSIKLKDRFFLIFIPLGLGVAVGLIPVFYYLIKSPELFFFNNLIYHLLNTDYRISTEYPRTMDLFSKLEFLLQTFKKTENLMLILGSAGFLLAFFRYARIEKKSLDDFLPHRIWLSFSIFVISAASIVIPTPMFIQYFAFPLSYLFLLFISSLSLPSQLSKNAIKGTLAVFLALALINSPFLFKKFPYPSKAEEIHQLSQRIARYVKGKDSKLATLSTLYAVEGNIPFYKELSTGPFVYRIGDYLSDAKLKRVNGTSSKTISKLLSNDQPAAILVGFEGRLDFELKQYALNHGYKKIPENFGGGILFVRSGEPK